MLADRLSPSLGAAIPYVVNAANDLVADEDRELVERMADVMVERIQKTGCCSTGILIGRGFAQDDVFRLWLPVCKLADEKMHFLKR
jgi:hypothetical protein